MTTKKTAAKAPLVKVGNIESLKFDDRNFNRHTEFGMSLIEKSIQRNGLGRSILVDKNNKIIAGNGVTEKAVSCGFKKTIEVEVTGEELVVVKRTDIDIDSKAGRELALADNQAAAADLAFDAGELKRAEQDFQLNIKEWGLDVKKLLASQEKAEGKDSNYSRKIEAPTYTPTGKCPKLSECFDTKKTDALIAEIKKAKLDKETEAFLIAAAHRHTVFNYQKIAEFYAHAPKKLQALMENSALVIIDYKKAVEQGFVKMIDKLKTEYGKEYES
jgi:hypothetical protein